MRSKILYIAAAICVSLASEASGQASYGLPLHDAIRWGDVEFVRSWVSAKKPLDVGYNDRSFSLENSGGRVRGLTPLMVAARFGKLEIAQLLVTGGANIYAESRNADETNPRNAFDYAVEAAHLPVAAYLWEKSDKIRFAGKLDEQLGRTYQLFGEDKFGSSDANNLALFLAKITVDEQTRGNGIALVACSPAGLVRLKFLADHGVNFPKNTLHCLTSYEGVHHFVTDPQSRIAIAKFLIAHGADPNAISTKNVHAPLTGAAGANDLGMVELLLANGANPNYQNAQGTTALMPVANQCSISLPGAGPNLQWEKTLQDRLAIVERLVAAGASMPPKQAIYILSNCCARANVSVAQKALCARFDLIAK